MTDQITWELRKLSAFANGIVPHKIAGPGFEPTMQDAIEIQKELGLLASRVDRVIEAYGEYLRSNGMVSADDVKDCFTGILVGALDGNALYVIQSGTQDRIDAIADDAAEHAAEMRREVVA